MWLWRDPEVRLSKSRLTTEAIVIGFGMAWFSTRFVRAGLPAFGAWVHAAACLVFSLQYLAVAIAIRLLRRRPFVVAAPIISIVAVVGELMAACWGISWIDFETVCVPIVP